MIAHIYIISISIFIERTDACGDLKRAPDGLVLLIEGVMLVLGTELLSHLSSPITLVLLLQLYNITWNLVL